MIPPLPVCQYTSLFSSATLDDVIVAFDIFLIGVALSLIVLCVELIWYNRKKMYGTKKTKSKKKANNFIFLLKNQPKYYSKPGISIKLVKPLPWND